MTDDDKKFLQIAIDLSKDFAARGGFPVGAIIVRNSEILSQGVSDGKRHNDSTWHAETDAIRKLCSELKTRDLNGVTLYSSMEPCIMCYGAAYWAGIDRIVFAAGKEELDKMHYEGVADSIEVNTLLHRNRPIELIHDKELEKAAMKVVHDYETSKGENG